MARPTIKVRSKTTGLTALVSPEALRHFPDYERVDTAPEVAFVAPPAAESADPKSSTRRSTAAKTTEEE